MKNYTIKLGLVLSIALMVAGCLGASSENGSVLHPASSPSPTLSDTDYSTRTDTQPTITSGPTTIALHTLPNPTLEAKSLEKLVQFLHSKACYLPCYLGITPGQTTWDEAKTILEDMGAFFTSGINQDNTIIYNTNLDIGDESLLGLTPEPNLAVTEVKIIQKLHIIVKDGLVQKIWTSVSTRKFISKFQEYWSRYTLRKVFQQFGVPDQVLTGKRDSGGTGYDLLAVYERYGLVFSVNGSAQNGFICPEAETTSIGLELSVTNPNSGLDLYAPAFIELPTSGVYVPIDQVLNIGKDEIYAQLIADSQACFEIKSH